MVPAIPKEETSKEKTEDGKSNEDSPGTGSNNTGVRQWLVEWPWANRRKRSLACGDDGTHSGNTCKHIIHWIIST